MIDLRALCALAIAAVVAACSSHPHPHPIGPPEPKGSATPVEIEPDAGVPSAGVPSAGVPSAGANEDGKAVFGQACARCHGSLGSPPPDMRSKLGVHDLTTPEFHARATRELVEHQVRSGSSNHVMSSFEGALTDAQIDAVSTYVLTLSPPTR